MAEIEIEEEEKEYEYDMESPLPAEKVKITSRILSLDVIIRRLENDEINLSPDFQRNPNLWDNSRQSRLIESIIWRLPLPIFYFDVSDSDKWIVIDGLQRLSAIKNFIVDKKLRLTNLEFSDEFVGVGYDELERKIKRVITETQIITYQLEAETPKVLKYSIFNRINTGGIPLNQQEIRQALNQKNKGVSYLKKIAESDKFKRIVPINSNRMIDRELVLRFLAFTYKFKEYKEITRPLPNLLDETMEDIDNLEKFTEEDFKNYKNMFFEALEYIEKIFVKEERFNKKIRDAKKLKTLNKSLFEIWTVLVSKLSKIEKDNLLKNKEVLLKKYKDLLGDKEFDTSISIGTNDRKSVIIRFDKLDKLLKEVLKIENKKS